MAKLGKSLSRLFFRVISKKAQKKGSLFCSAVIVAAGSCTRMGGIDKIYSPLCGRPVLIWTLQAFEDCREVSEIVLVVRADKLVESAQMCKLNGITKVTKVISGGKSRAESVLLGINEVSERASFVAVHDGARPLVTNEVIVSAIFKAKTCGAATAHIPVADTIKTHRGGFVTGTPKRGELCLVQTPQVFDADMIKGVLFKAVENNWDITDDASAVERCGLAVALSEGSPENIKLTTPSDLLAAEAIVKARMNL